MLRVYLQHTIMTMLNIINFYYHYYYYYNVQASTLFIDCGGLVNRLAANRKISGAGLPFLIKGLSEHIACDKHCVISG